MSKVKEHLQELLEAHKGGKDEAILDAKIKVTDDFESQGATGVVVRTNEQGKKRIVLLRKD